MQLRGLRTTTGALLTGSGALMAAASWQRWAGVCGWGDVDSAGCLERQDHRYDVLAPSAPWEPVGIAPELAGASLLVLAVALLLLPWALTGRRPGPVSAVAVAGAAVGSAAMGVTALGSGLSGEVVEPVGGDVTIWVWLLLTPVVLVHLAVLAHGWRRTAAVLLVLGAPPVALFSYAVGPYDARPWWEAVSGLLVVAAGACVVGAGPAGRRPDGAGSSPASSTSRAGREEVPTHPVR